MIKDKIQEIQEEMRNENHKAAFNIFKGLAKVLLNINHDDNGNQAQELYVIIIKYFLFILVILVMLGPFANAGLIEEKKTMIINIINCFFYLIGILGLFGRCTCCCFYRPCNWIMTMLLCDLIVMSLNITIIVLTENQEFTDNTSLIIIISCFNTLFVMIIIANHFKAYFALRDVYIRAREFEIKIIKECAKEFVGKL